MSEVSSMAAGMRGEGGGCRACVAVAARRNRCCALVPEWSDEDSAEVQRCRASILHRHGERVGRQRRTAYGHVRRVAFLYMVPPGRAGEPEGEAIAAHLLRHLDLWHAEAGRGRGYDELRRRLAADVQDGGRHVDDHRAAGGRVHADAARYRDGQQGSRNEGRVVLRVEGHRRLGDVEPQGVVHPCGNLDAGYGGADIDHLHEVDGTRGVRVRPSALATGAADVDSHVAVGHVDGRDSRGDVWRVGEEDVNSSLTSLAWSSDCRWTWYEIHCHGNQGDGQDEADHGCREDLFSAAHARSMGEESI